MDKLRPRARRWSDERFRRPDRRQDPRAVPRPGDYVFVQFGHNDQKEKGEGVGAFTTYAGRLRD